MTEAEIKNRVQRVYAAFQDKTALKPEDVGGVVFSDETSVGFYQDFRGGRSPTQLEGDAAQIINEIMGIRDRAKKWLTNKGDDPKQVDAFVKSEFAVALVHDLANTDKHGELDYKSMSGVKPNLEKVDRVMSGTYDPVTGTYPQKSVFIGPSFDMQTGQITGTGSSSGMEVVLDSDIKDEQGNKVGELKKVLPDAIYKWEQFLIGLGLSLN